MVFNIAGLSVIYDKTRKREKEKEDNLPRRIICDGVDGATRPIVQDGNTGPMVVQPQVCQISRPSHFWSRPTSNSPGHWSAQDGLIFLFELCSSKESTWSWATTVY